MNNCESPVETEIVEMVQSLSDWVSKQPHLPSIHDDKKILRKFLVNCKYRVQKAKEKIDRYYSGRTNYPNIFGNRDPMHQSIQTISKLCPIFPLPKRTSRGELAIVIATGPNIADIIPIDLLRYLTMVMDVVLLEEDDSLDFILIVDYRMFSYQHLLKLTTILAPLSEHLRSMYPGKLKADHFLQVPSFIDTFVTALKKLIPPKQRDRIFVYKDLKNFYKVINRQILPSDLGGDEKSVRELNDEYREKIQSYRSWFKSQEDVRSIEELRPAVSKYIGGEGSFRNIRID